MSNSEQEPGRTSFEARLQTAQSRHRSDGQSAAKSAGDMSDLSTGLRVGVELVSALAVAVAIGWGLDHWLHTLPLFLIIFVVLGGAAGLMNLWRQMSPGARRRSPGVK